jgi:hypothetical protein
MAALRISGKIPEKPLGGLVEALTDVIRPFSESRGLRADQIRLQREEVAIKIAKLARERALIDGHISSVPPKFLVPFLEKASLEDSDNSDMISLWANLLASASRGFQAPMYRFVSVLSELAPEHARVLRLVAVNDSEINDRIDFSADFYCSPNLIMRFCMERFNQADVDVFANAFFEEFSCHGSFFIDMSIYVGDDGYTYHTPCKELKLTDIEDSIGVLSSLGLVRRDIIPDINVGDGNAIFLDMATLTSFGADFFKACEGIGHTPLSKESKGPRTKASEQKPQGTKQASKKKRSH